MRYRLAAFLVSSFALVAQAQDPGIVAVLPLADAAVGKTQKVDPTAKLLLEEAIRTVAGDNLSPRGFTILTGENTLQVLADNGIDPDQACESSCALEAARELKAELLISGTVAFSEGWYTAFIRLFESKTGRQLGSVEAEGKTVRDVRKSFSELAPEFFSRVPGGKPPPTRRATVEQQPRPPAPAPPPVRKEPAPSPPVQPVERARQGFGLNLGVGSDLGIVGVSLELRSIASSVAVGASYLGEDWYSIQLGGRYRFGNPEKSGFYAGAAVSFSFDDSDEMGTIVFAGGGWEWVFAKHYALRVGLNAAVAYFPEEEVEIDSPFTVMPYPDLAFSVRF